MGEIHCCIPNIIESVHNTKCTKGHLGYSYISTRCPTPEMSVWDNKKNHVNFNSH